MTKPKLRFPEFTDEWNEKTLDKLFEYKNGDSLENSLDENGNYYLISLNSIDKNGNLQNKLKRVINAKWFLKKNDIVMVLSDIGKGNFLGLSEIIPEDNKYVLNQRMGLLRAKAEINITYAKVYINFSQKYFKSCGQGSAQLNISKGDVLKFVFKIPCIKEQQKIADFLSKVDEKIINQEVVISDYEEMKKGLMQKIFSQEIRFKADDGSEYPEWEEKTFIEVFNFIQNNTFPRDCLNKDEGETHNIHYGDVLIKYGLITDICKEEIPFINTDISLNKFTKESYLRNGDIVIADTAEDMTVGKATEICGAAEKKVLSGLHTIPCRPKMTFAPRYLGYYINSEEYHNQLMPLVQGIKVSSISKGNISKTIITYPCLEEQQKIADCLSAMDRKIETEKQILEDWKELKKALLQQMFI